MTNINEQLEMVSMHTNHKHTYRVIQDFRAELQEVISYVFVMKKVLINIRPILDGNFITKNYTQQEIRLHT
jgi:hypothetical protein